MLEAVEQSSALYRATLTDEDGAHPALATIASWVVSLSYPDGTAINGLDQEPLVTAGAIVDATRFTYDEVTGVFEWRMAPGDNGLANQTRRHETHELVFEVTYGPSGSRRFNHCTAVVVRNCRKIT